jgi:hypothetical protein
VDVLGIERSDKGLIQTRKNVVNDLIALLFQLAYFGSDFRKAWGAAPNALKQKSGCSLNNLGLVKKQLIELLPAWQQSHDSSASERVNRRDTEAQA